jgi:hypothetical protein
MAKKKNETKTVETNIPATFTVHHDYPETIPATPDFPHERRLEWLDLEDFLALTQPYQPRSKSQIRDNGLAILATFEERGLEAPCICYVRSSPMFKGELALAAGGSRKFAIEAAGELASSLTEDGRIPVYVAQDVTEEQAQKLTFDHYTTRKLGSLDVRRIVWAWMEADPETGEAPTIRQVVREHAPELVQMASKGSTSIGINKANELLKRIEETKPGTDTMQELYFDYAKQVEAGVKGFLQDCQTESRVEDDLGNRVLQQALLLFTEKDRPETGLVSEVASLNRPISSNERRDLVACYKADGRSDAEASDDWQPLERKDDETDEKFEKRVLRRNSTLLMQHGRVGESFEALFRKIVAGINKPKDENAVPAQKALSATVLNNRADHADAGQYLKAVYDSVSGRMAKSQKPTKAAQEQHDRDLKGALNAIELFTLSRETPEGKQAWADMAQKVRQSILDAEQAAEKEAASA